MLTKRYSPVTILLTLILFTAWPHWCWLAERFSGGSNETIVLIAIAPFAIALINDRKGWIHFI